MWCFIVDILTHKLLFLVALCLSYKQHFAQVWSSDADMFAWHTEEIKAAQVDWWLFILTGGVRVFPSLECVLQNKDWFACISCISSSSLKRVILTLIVLDVQELLCYFQHRMRNQFNRQFEAQVNRKTELSWKSHLDQTDICTLEVCAESMKTYTLCSYTHLHTVNNFSSLIARC